MDELLGAAPVWLWPVLSALAGGVLVLAWPAAVDLWWLMVETVTAWVARFCLLVGVLVLVAGAVWVLLVASGVLQPPRFA